MEQLFLSYDLSRKFAEAGLKTAFFGEYRQHDGSGEWLHLYQYEEGRVWRYTVECKAPTYQEAKNWLRENFGIIVNADYENGNYLYSITFMAENDKLALSGFGSYYEALEKGLERALNISCFQNS